MDLTPLCVIYTMLGSRFEAEPMTTIVSIPTRPVPALSPDALRQRFGPIFARIGEGALDRERNRTLAHEPVSWLRQAGFGALRIPVALGGHGASLRELFALLVDLAAADPNLPQILRAHFAFVEGLLGDADAERGSRWMRVVADGALFGAAMAELGPATEINTRLTPSPSGGWRLDGTKYYSTGTLYADWIVAAAAEGEDRVLLAVEVGAPGVTREDDWDGFGQRLTGSGTTRFEDVAVAADRVLRRSSQSRAPSESFMTAYYQLFHLATLAGIGRAVLRDAVAFVQPRTRTFYLPGKAVPREDPLVQRVVGRLASLAFSAEALADRVAAGLEALSADWQAGDRDDPRFLAVEIEAFQAQQVILPQVLEAATLLFEVGGASAVSEALGLDRHWRNARVLASHNPAIQRERMIGDYLLNGAVPGDSWNRALERQRADARPAG